MTVDFDIDYKTYRDILDKSGKFIEELRTQSLNALKIPGGMMSAEVTWLGETAFDGFEFEGKTYRHVGDSYSSSYTDSMSGARPSGCKGLKLTKEERAKLTGLQRDIYDEVWTRKFGAANRDYLLVTKDRSLGIAELVLGGNPSQPYWFRAE